MQAAANFKEQRLTCNALFLDNWDFFSNIAVGNFGCNKLAWRKYHGDMLSPPEDFQR